MDLYYGRNSDFPGCFCAINGTQLLVKFSKAVNAQDISGSAWTSSAANKANYALTGGNTVGLAVVQADGKSVVLTLGTPVLNTVSATYALNVSGVTTDDTVTQFPTYAGVVTVKDTVAPTVTAASSSTNGATASSTTLTFSKPVVSVGAIKIDGTLVSTSNYTLASGATTLTLNNLSLDSSKTHSIEVVNLADASGNVNSYQTTTLTVKKDAVAPTISSVTAKGDNALEITFSKPMGTVTSGSFTLKDEAYGDIPGVSVTPDLNDTTGTKYVATFTQGATFFTNSSTRNLTLVVAGTGVSDTLGNVLAATTKTVSITKDTTAPSATGVTVQKDATGKVTSFTVNFNKPLAAGTITSDNVTLVDANGILLDTDSAHAATTAVIGNATVVVGSTKAVFAVTNNATFTGKYSFTLNANTVTDQSFTGNKNASFGTIVDAGTSTAGTFTANAATTSSALTSGVYKNVITVTYSTAVKGGLVAGSATDASNYTYNGHSLPAGTTITLDSTQKIAAITLPAGTISATDAGTIFKVSGVMSTIGGTVTPLVKTLTLTDNTAPVLKTGNLNADGSVSLGFDATVATVATLTATNAVKDLAVKVNGTSLTGAAPAFTVADGTGADAGKYVLKVNASKQSIKSDASKHVVVNGVTYTATTALDEILFNFIDANGDGALNTGDIVLSATDSGTTPVTFAANGNYDLTTASSVTVGTSATPAYITDAAGNVVTASTTITVK